MFELTNEQRKCFGLLPVEKDWTLLELKASPYDQFRTFAYIDGTVVRKCILSAENRLTEYELCEQLSEDLKYLLPKTPKGKPVLLRSSTLCKRSGIGMCVSFFRSNNGIANIDVYSHVSQQGYYTNEYTSYQTIGQAGPQQWIENWCAETTDDDLQDIARFAALSRKHIQFREGDVFRFKIDRHLYGYGRILVDYAQMRKTKEPFWDILMGKPLVCSVYHIATTRKDVSVEELQQYDSLPSAHMMDNRIYYGEYEIIGNIPIGEREDYPIMYGDSIDVRQRAVCLQCGKLYRKKAFKQVLFGGYHNNSIGFGLNFRLSVLQECIKAGSNAPYWEQDIYKVNHDLRNPKFRNELERVCQQFNLSPSQLIK